MVSLLEHSKIAVLILSILYLIISVIVFVLAVKATLADPTDPVIYAQRLTESKG